MASPRQECALPDLNRELKSAVGTADPQPGAPDRSGQRRTPTARKNAPERMSKDMPDRMPERMSEHMPLRLPERMPEHFAIKIAR